MCRTQISLTRLKINTTTGNWVENMSSAASLPRGTSAECPDYNHLTSLFIPSSNTQSPFRLTEWPTDSAAFPVTEPETQIRHHYNTNQRLRTRNCTEGIFWSGLDRPESKNPGSGVDVKAEAQHAEAYRGNQRNFSPCPCHTLFWLERVMFIRGKSWRWILPVWLGDSFVDSWAQTTGVW